METTLRTFIGSLQSSVDLLKKSDKENLLHTLHRDSGLPDGTLHGLASQALDLLHEATLLLEPGPQILADHFLGYTNTKCLCVAVELNIPDILEDGAKDITTLAQTSNARADRLQQIMRPLYNNGIFSFEPTTGLYSNNRVSKLLLSGHWTQWRNWVDLYGNEFYDMARGIVASCRKDAVRTPAQINFDTDADMFTYFSDRGWLSRLHKTLSGGAIAQAPGILEDYPWEEVSSKTVFDIGGGSGGLVALLLRKHQNMKAGILDLPKVIRQATSNFHEDGGAFTDVGARVPKQNLIAGDFLKEIPPFEVYTIKWCLHDWGDAQALRILKNIRASIVRSPQSRLIILESLLQDGHSGKLARYADINMMLTIGGKERTEQEWKDLAEQTGWELRFIHTLRNAWPSAIELRPVWISSPNTEQINRSQDLEHHSNAIDHGPSNEVPDGVEIRYSSTMSFLEPWDSSRPEPFYRSAPDEGFDSINFKWSDHSVTVTDARPKKQIFELDTHGFCFRDEAEGLTNDVLEALRSNDDKMVRDLYYPRIESFMKQETGARRVIIFDHTVRRRNPNLGTKENPDGKEQPATVVHCDQSEPGAIRRLQQNIGESEDISDLLKGRFQMINVWRPLKGPVEDWPLAMMDYGSLDPSDMHPCNLWRHQYEPRGQTMTFCYSSSQRWYYLGEHRTDEVTLIKIWDNKTGVKAPRCPHAAFKHPETPVDADPRESVEVRCILLH